MEWLGDKVLNTCLCQCSILYSTTLLTCVTISLQYLLPVATMQTALSTVERSNVTTSIWQAVMVTAHSACAAATCLVYVEHRWQHRSLFDDTYYTALVRPYKSGSRDPMLTVWTSQRSSKLVHQFFTMIFAALLLTFMLDFEWTEHGFIKLEIFSLSFYNHFAADDTRFEGNVWSVVYCLPCCVFVLYQIWRV